MLRGLVLCFALVSLCVMFSCAGGGVRPNTPQATASPVNLAMPPKADVVAGRTVSWDEEGAPDFAKWDIIFGQQYPLGTAEIVLDGGAYYMKYTLTQAAIDDGWRYIDAAVNLWVGEPPDKADVPGKYPYKWSVAGYDAGLTEVLLPIGTSIPEDFGIAIHASLWQPTYDAYGTLTGYNNETGWGGLYWATKARAEGAYWTGNWKKWGGYMTYSDTKAEVLPVFTPFDMTFSALYNYDLGSYWKLRFTTSVPGSLSPYTWDYIALGGVNYTRGWCVDPQYLANVTETAKVYSCFDPSLPNYAKDPDWDIISYMLDQRYGGSASNPNIYFSASVNTFQKALWYFKYGNYQVDYNGANADTRIGGYDAATHALIDDATANGENYVPGPGDWFAGVMWPGNNIPHKYGSNPAGNENTNYQMLIVGIDP